MATHVATRSLHAGLCTTESSLYNISGMSACPYHRYVSTIAMSASLASQQHRYVSIIASLPSLVAADGPGGKERVVMGREIDAVLSRDLDDS